MVLLIHMANIVTESRLGPEAEYLLRCGHLLRCGFLSVESSPLQAELRAPLWLPLQHEEGRGLSNPVSPARANDLRGCTR